MKIYNEEVTEKQNSTHILLLDKKEAQLLVDMVCVAANTVKRKPTYRRMADKLLEKLCCF